MSQHATQTAEQADYWMTVSQIRQHASRGRNHIREAMRTGALPAAQNYVGCTWRALRTDVDAWVANGAPTSTRPRRRGRAA
ncbi:helix-turn-helix domain-containing protein [Labedaea rhizosphaerae]|uniref:Excisionase family DNA binding protein n=1 Tax=Labedaea rhizosphaerae TaxID=598644 RepID=A0A4R6SC83_LABRH|nr:helix-turn-helix domain-containing protein [Labedaea rhizosphaerae]TDP97679.1 hypothetical protein EV186_103643 [Labedaea rhizosphaerae]